LNEINQKKNNMSGLEAHTPMMHWCVYIDK